MIHATIIDTRRAKVVACCPASMAEFALVRTD